MLQWDLALGSRDIHVLRDIHDGFLFFRVPTHFQAEIFFWVVQQILFPHFNSLNEGSQLLFSRYGPGQSR